MTEVATASIAVSLMFNGVGTLAWYSAGILLLFILILTSIDLLVNLRQQRKLGIELDWGDEIAARLLILFLIPLSLMADVALYLLTQLLPRDFLILDRGWLFFTITTLIWLTIAYMLKILDHVRDHGGAEYVPPTLQTLTHSIQSFLRAVRVVDTKRYQANHPGHPLPSRWLDNLSADQVARITLILEEKIDEDGKLVIPNDPTELLEEDKG